MISTFFSFLFQDREEEFPRVRDQQWSTGQVPAQMQAVSKLHQKRQFRLVPTLVETSAHQTCTLSSRW